MTDLTLNRWSSLKVISLVYVTNLVDDHDASALCPGSRLEGRKIAVSTFVVEFLDIYAYSNDLVLGFVPVSWASSLCPLFEWGAEFCYWGLENERKLRTSFAEFDRMNRQLEVRRGILGLLAPQVYTR